MRKTIFIVCGTRPEVIKLAPIYLALKNHSNHDVQWVATGQHSDMAAGAMACFGIEADHQFDVMSASLGELTAKLSTQLETLYKEQTPDMVIVQGDTTSAFMGALSAYYQQIAVVHIEAGLRSHNPRHPFPEELNRKLIGSLASIHCAPTPLSASNLRAEGVDENTVVTTGNTVVDALAIVREQLDGIEAPIADWHGRRLLVTMHRREAWGDDMNHMCSALLTLVEQFEDVQVVFPVHRNPIVSDAVYSQLGDHPRIVLMEPVDYFALQKLLASSYLVLTDSGGIQEEAPSYQLPTLVMRKLTERPEAMDKGMAKVVGMDFDVIVNEASNLLSNSQAYKNMAGMENPFGDGKSSQRTVTIINNYFSGQQPFLEKSQEFL